MTNHLIFLCRCRDIKLIPPGLTIKIPVNSRKAPRIIKWVGHELVWDRIQNIRWKKQQLCSEISCKLAPFLERITLSDDRTRIQQYLDDAYNQEFQEVKSCQIKKLVKMKTTCYKRASPLPSSRCCCQCSKCQLTASEKTVLNKGLNFATTIKQIPYLDLIAPIEEAALNIPQAQEDELRWKVRQVLEKSKPPNPNITKEERLAIKSLQCDESIIILLANKGNATVVMDRVEYFNKLADLIENSGYCKVKKNPTLKTKRKPSQILSKNKDLVPQRKYKQLIQHYSKLPHIYGLPKIHKDGISLRPIVSCRGSACHPLSCYLVEIVTPLSDKSSSYVRNSTHFMEKIRNAPIHSNRMVSLFTKVPMDETLAVVRERLAADSSLEERTCISINNLMEMLTFCVETTYFEMGSDIYWQVDGLAMGSPLSPVLANIYMEHFEEMALGSTPVKPSMWLRYIDDTFILWPHQEDVKILMNHVNSIRPSIQFTIEKEQDNKLSFLDVLITRTEYGFSTSVYHKPTFTRQYLNFYSHHPYNVKKGIVRCLQHRAKAISSNKVYQKEMDSLKKTLSRNNYPETITSATINLDHKTE